VPTAYLTRTVQFAATHRYLRPEWSEARNGEVFGTCTSSHGHTYACAITVTGPMDPTTAMVVDLGALDRILREEVVDRYDRRDLNRDAPEFADGRTLPTGEALCVEIWRRVAPRLPSGCSLVRVRVAEDATLSAEYRGEE
jgi:6-pyruvoyltetrahydropterin/6-carboxytetrahydropterin synthase